MHARHNNWGEVTIQYNSQTEAILSPDARLKLLPCDTCGQTQWVGLGTVSVMCHACYEGVLVN